MEIKLSEIKDLADAIRDLAKALGAVGAVEPAAAAAHGTGRADPHDTSAPAAADVPVSPPSAGGSSSAVPTGVPVATAPVYTLEQIARASATLRDAGRLQDLGALLAQFGVQTLQQVPADRYGEFATALRGMGAKI